MSIFTDKPIITPKVAIIWLEDCANYFEKEAIATKEDSLHWAYRSNADICRGIKELIENSIVNE